MREVITKQNLVLRGNAGVLKIPPGETLVVSESLATEISRRGMGILGGAINPVVGGLKEEPKKTKKGRKNG